MTTAIQRRKIGTIIAIVAIVFLTFVCLKAYFDIKKNMANGKTVFQYDKVIEKQIDMEGVKVWMDKYNNEHLALESIKVKDVVMQLYADSLAHLLNITAKQVQAISNIKTSMEFKNKLKVDTVYIDSTHQYQTFVWNDKWISIKGDIGNTDSILITGTDTLTKVDYWKRKWLLGAKHYYVDISNENPYIKLTGLKSVEIQSKKKTRLGIGPYIGIGYNINGTNVIDFKKPQVSFGIGINYQLIKL